MKLPILSGKEVCKILKKFGFEEIRRKGSHIVIQKKIERERNIYFSSRG